MSRATFFVLAKGALAVILFLLPLVIPECTSATTRGTISAQNLMMVVDRYGKVVGVYPQDLSFIVSYTKQYESRHINATKVLYSVLECNAYWILGVEPGLYYIPDIDAVIRVEPRSIEKSCHAQVETQYNGSTKIDIGSVAVQVSTWIDITFVSVGARVSEIPIGQLFVKYVTGFNPVFGYTVVVRKVVNDYEYTDTHIEHVTVNMEQEVVRIFVVDVWLKNLTLSKYQKQGDLQAGGVIISPLYAVEVCGKVSETYRTFLAVDVSVYNKGVTLLLRPGIAECKKLEDLALPPGANQSVVLNIRTGVFSIQAEYVVDVEGLVVSISKPVAKVIASGSTWIAVVQTMVGVSGYYRVFPTVSVHGEVFNEVFGSIDCVSPRINGSGGFTLLCQKSITGDIEERDIADSIFVASVTYTDEGGKSWNFEAHVKAFIMSMGSVAGQIMTMYTLAGNLLLGGILAIVLILVVSHFKEMITGYHLVDPYLLRGALMTVTVSYVILAFIIPGVYYVFGKIVENTPILNKYISVPATPNPRDAVGAMVSYYDQLFATIMKDYEVEFVGSLGRIMTWVQLMAAIGMGLMVVALALSTFWTPGAGIPFSSVASGLFSLVFGILSMLMMQIQMGVFVIVGVTVASIMVAVVTAVVLSLMLLGVVLICIPTHSTQRLGEDIFGASLLYLIVFPLLAPISYAIYSHLMDVVRTGGVADVLGGACIFLIAPICLSGFVTNVIRMVVFVVASGAATMLVLGSLGYILSRTGVATGIGEALSSLVWRG